MIVWQKILGGVLVLAAITWARQIVLIISQIWAGSLWPVW